MAEETIIDLLQIKIEKAKDKLPGATKVAIASVDWKGVIKGMKEKKGYSIEQMDALELETELLLAGLLNPDNYAKELETRMKIARPQVEILVAEINSFIFEKIKDELIKIVDRKSILEKTMILPKKETSLEDKVSNENLVTQKPDSRFTNLPTNIKDIINTSNYQPKIYILGKENNLTIAQITALEGLVTDTILGVIPPENFEIRARSIAGIDESRLKLLVGEINNKILKDIRSKILGLENKNKTDLPSYDKVDLEPEVKPIIKDNVNNATEVAPQKTEKIDQVTQAPIPTVKTSSNTNIVNSIVLNKLSGAVKSTGAVTEYSLNNISKPNENSKQGNTATNPQKVDPYRMPTE